MNTMNALITRDFETPLSRNITLHTNNVTTNEKKFDKDRKKMEDGIKSTEGKMGKMSKKKGSDLQAFQAVSCSCLCISTIHRRQELTHGRLYLIYSLKPRDWKNPELNIRK